MEQTGDLNNSQTFWTRQSGVQCSSEIIIVPSLVSLSIQIYDI